MTILRASIRSCIALAASALALGFLALAYLNLLRLDFGDQFEKLAWFVGIFVTVLVFMCLPSGLGGGGRVRWVEIVFLLIILSWSSSSHWDLYASDLATPPRSDIGYTTVHAAILLFVEGNNPYSSEDINNLGQHPAGYRGFHYGPLSIVGYLLSIHYTWGFKFSSLLFAITSLILLGSLASDASQPRAEQISAAAFAITAYIIPDRVWYELFYQGAIDFFPVMLMLGALLAMKKEEYFWAGLLTALSFSAKFAPAIFLLPFLPYRKKVVWPGLAIGFLPMLPFLLWDFGGFVRNVFLLRLTLPPDMTSLYWVTPSSLHWIFPAAIGTAWVVAFLVNLKKDLDIRSVIGGFALVMLVGQVTFREVHGNHMLWSIPVLALVFAWGRIKIFETLAAHFRPRSGLQAT